jgi:hypothetical protein
VRLNHKAPGLKSNAVQRDNQWHAERINGTHSRQKLQEEKKQSSHLFSLNLVCTVGSGFLRV